MIGFSSSHVTMVATSSLEIGAAIGLIAFLVTKELCDASGSSRLANLGRHLDVAVIPLLIVFASTFVAEVAGHI